MDSKSAGFSLRSLESCATYALRFKETSTRHRAYYQVFDPTRGFQTHLRWYTMYTRWTTHRVSSIWWSFEKVSPETVRGTKTRPREHVPLSADSSVSGARRRAPESVEWFKRCEIFLSKRTTTRRTQRRALRTSRGEIVHGVSRHRAPRDRWLLGSRSRLDDALKRTIPTLRLTTKLYHVARPRSRWLD